MKKLQVQNVCGHVLDWPAGSLVPAEVAEVEASPEIDVLLAAGLLIEVEESTGEKPKKGDS